MQLYVRDVNALKQKALDTLRSRLIEELSFEWPTSLEKDLETLKETSRPADRKLLQSAIQQKYW